MNNRVFHLAVLSFAMCMVCTMQVRCQDLNTILMESTFRIEGPQKGTGQLVTGTVFIMGLPSPSHPKKVYYVLVTANHVLDTIATDYASLILRSKDSNGVFNKEIFDLHIRSQGKPLWTRHPDSTIDVAAMYVLPPSNLKITFLPTSFLATDSVFNRYEIHPGDELFCLGYPFGVESNEAGFAVLRSGKIASYPLTPAARYKSLLFDFQVFGGNSGGPVYFSQLFRTYRGKFNYDPQVEFIVGLVSEEVDVTQTLTSLYETRKQRYPIGLAKVILAQFIKETIDLLPKMD